MKLKNNSSSEGEKAQKRISLIPTQASEIPTVEALVCLGEANLRRLEMAVIQRLQGELLQSYVKVIREACHKSEAILPMLPDLRTENWVYRGERVLFYVISADSTGPISKTRRLHPYKAKTERLKIGGDGSVVDLQLRLLNPDHALNPMTEGFSEIATFDLRSPYVLKLDEAHYLRRHPMALQTWMEYCGAVDSEWQLNFEMKRAWISRFGSQRSDLEEI